MESSSLELVFYVGSLRCCHGLAELVGLDGGQPGRFLLRTLDGDPLVGVRPESFVSAELGAFGA